MALGPGSIEFIGINTANSAVSADDWVAFATSTNRGLSATADSVYAYLAASDATANTPTTHLAYINIGNAVDGTAPSTLAANDEVTFTNGADSAIYSGPHSGQASFGDYH